MSQLMNYKIFVFFPIREHLSKLGSYLNVSLDAGLDKAWFEGGVDSSAHGHISGSTDAGITLEALQAGHAAKIHEARSTCRDQVIHSTNLLLTENNLETVEI